MKKIILLIALVFYSLSYSQVKEYKVSKLISPQFGRIPSGDTVLYINDTLITVKAKNKTVNYKVEVLSDDDFSKSYLSKYNSQNEIRFTYYKSDNYLKFENKDNFSGKIGELLYYFN